MISKKTWDQIQIARSSVAKPRKRRGEKGLAFLNFATCGSCGHCITGERHKKKSGLVFHYYRCTHKNSKRGCENSTFIRQEIFAKEIKRNVQLVTLPDEWKERFLAKLEIWDAEGSTTRQTQVARLKDELEAVRAKIDRLNSGFTDGSIDLAEFKELKNPLIPKKVELDGQMTALEKTRTNRVEPLRNWILEANHGEKLLAQENFGEMKSFLQKVGLNRVFREKSLTVSFIKPWDSLAQTVTNSFADNEYPHGSEKWWR